jgi:hypothetical protein
VTACLPAGDQRKHPTYVLIVLPVGPRTIRSQDLDWDFKRGRLKWRHQHPEAVDMSQWRLLNKSTHHLSCVLHCWVFGVGARQPYTGIFGHLGLDGQCPLYRFIRGLLPVLGGYRFLKTPIGSGYHKRLKLVPVLFLGQYRGKVSNILFFSAHWFSSNWFS